MRRALLSVAVAVVGAAGVTAGGWALQAAALPAPTPAATVAADASAWLHEHRFVVDVFHRHHRRIEGACLRGWFPGQGGPIARASLLAVGSEPTLRIPVRRHVRLTLGGRGQGPSNRILAFVGCSGELLQVFGGAAQSGGRLSTERSYAAGQPAIALELERGEEGRFTLYVSPRTYRPLVAFVDLEGDAATARLYLGRATPRLLRRYHLPAKPRR
jgi:hypothetical protein